MGSMVPPSVMNISKNLKKTVKTFIFSESIIFKFDCESTSFFICYKIGLFLSIFTPKVRLCY